MAGKNNYQIYTQVNFKLTGVDESVSRAKSRLRDLADSIVKQQERLNSRKDDLKKAGMSAADIKADPAVAKMSADLKAMQNDQKQLKVLVDDSVKSYNVLKKTIEATDGMTPKSAEYLRANLPKVLKSINDLGAGAQEKIRGLAEVMRVTEGEIKKFAAGVVNVAKPFDKGRGETIGESKAYVDLFRKLGRAAVETDQEFQTFARHAAESMLNIAKKEGTIRSNTNAQREYIDSLKASIEYEQKLQNTKGTSAAARDTRIMASMRERQYQEELGGIYSDQLKKSNRASLGVAQMQEAATGAQAWLDSTKKHNAALEAEYKRYQDFTNQFFTGEDGKLHSYVLSTKKEYDSAIEAQRVYNTQEEQLLRQEREQKIQAADATIQLYEQQQAQIRMGTQLNAATIVSYDEYKRQVEIKEQETAALEAGTAAYQRREAVIRSYNAQMAQGLDAGRGEQLQTWNQNYVAQTAERQKAERALQKDINDTNTLLLQTTKVVSTLTADEKTTMHQTRGDIRDADAAIAGLNAQMDRTLAITRNQREANNQQLTAELNAARTDQERTDARMRWAQREDDINARSARMIDHINSKLNEQNQIRERAVSLNNDLTARNTQRQLTEQGSLQLLGYKEYQKTVGGVTKDVFTTNKLNKLEEDSLKGVKALWNDIVRDLKQKATLTADETKKLAVGEEILRRIKEQEAQRVLSGSKTVAQLEEEYRAYLKINETAMQGGKGGMTLVNKNNDEIRKTLVPQLQTILGNAGKFADSELQTALKLSKEILGTDVLRAKEQNVLNEYIRQGNQELAKRSDKTTTSGYLGQLGAKKTDIDAYFGDSGKNIDVATMKLKNMKDISDPLLQQMIKGMEGVINHAKDMGLEFAKDEEFLKRLNAEQARRKAEVGDTRAVASAERVMQNPLIYSSQEVTKALQDAEAEMRRLKAAGDDSWKDIARNIETTKNTLDTFNLASKKIQMGNQYDRGLDKLSDKALLDQINYWRELQKAERNATQAVEVYDVKIGELQRKIRENATKDITNMLNLGSGNINSPMATQYKQGTLTSDMLGNLNAGQLKEMQTNIQNLLNSANTGDDKAIKELNADLKVTEEQLMKLNKAWMSEADAKKMASAITDKDALKGTGLTYTIENLERAKKALEDYGNTKLEANSKEWKDNAAQVKALDEEIKRLKKDMTTSTGGGSGSKEVIDPDKLKAIKAAAEQGEHALRKLFDSGTENGLKISLKDLQLATKEWGDELKRTSDMTASELAKAGLQLSNVDKVQKELTDSTKHHTSTLENAIDRLKNYVLVYVGFQQVSDQVIGELKKNFELSDEMANVQKVTKMATDEVGNLSRGLAELDSRTEHSTLMKLAFEGGKMGIGSGGGNGAVQELTSFVDTANKLNMSLGEDFGGTQAIASLAKLTKVMQVEAKENVTVNQALSKTASAILELGNNSIASYPKISQFATRMGGIAMASKMTMPELLALGSTLDTFGAQSEMAATAMTKFISKLIKEPEVVAKAVGASQEEMQKLVWNGQTMDAMQLVFDSLKKNGADLETIAGNLKDLVGGGNNTRAMQVLTEMAHGADTLREHLEMSKNAFDANVNVNEEYLRMNATAQASISRIGNAIHEAFANDSTVKVFNTIFGGIADVITGIEHLKSRFTLFVVACWMTLKLYSSRAYAHLSSHPGMLLAHWVRSITNFKALLNGLKVFALGVGKAIVGALGGLAIQGVFYGIYKLGSLIHDAMYGARDAARELSDAIRDLVREDLSAINREIKDFAGKLDMLGGGKNTFFRDFVKSNKDVSKTLTDVNKTLEDNKKKNDESKVSADKSAEANKKNADNAKAAADASKAEAEAKKDSAKVSADAAKASEEAAKKSTEAAKAEAEAKAKIAEANANAAKASMEAAKAEADAQKNIQEELAKTAKAYDAAEVNVRKVAKSAKEGLIKSLEPYDGVIGSSYARKNSTHTNRVKEGDYNQTKHRLEMYLKLQKEAAGEIDILFNNISRSENALYEKRDKLNKAQQRKAAATTKFGNWWWGNDVELSEKAYKLELEHMNSLSSKAEKLSKEYGFYSTNVTSYGKGFVELRQYIKETNGYIEEEQSIGEKILSIFSTKARAAETTATEKSVKILQKEAEVRKEIADAVKKYYEDEKKAEQERISNFVNGQESIIELRKQLAEQKKIEDAAEAEYKNKGIPASREADRIALRTGDIGTPNYRELTEAERKKMEAQYGVWREYADKFDAETKKRRGIEAQIKKETEMYIKQYKDMQPKNLGDADYLVDGVRKAKDARDTAFNEMVNSEGAHLTAMSDQVKEAADKDVANATSAATAIINAVTGTQTAQAATVESAKTASNAIEQNTDSIKTNTGAVEEQTSAKEDNASKTEDNINAEDANSKAIASETDAVNSNTDAQKENTKERQANKEQIDLFNSTYGTYAGFILDETAKMYDLAEAIAFVTAKRKEDAYAKALGNVEEKREEKYGKVLQNGRDNLNQIFKKLNGNGGGATALSASFDQFLKDALDETSDGYIKNFSVSGTSSNGAAAIRQWLEKSLRTKVKGKYVAATQEKINEYYNAIISSDSGVNSYVKNLKKANAYQKDLEDNIKADMKVQAAKSNKIAKEKVQELINDVNAARQRVKNAESGKKVDADIKTAQYDVVKAEKALQTFIEANGEDFKKTDQKTYDLIYGKEDKDGNRKGGILSSSKESITQARKAAGYLKYQNIMTMMGDEIVEGQRSMLKNWRKVTHSDKTQKYIDEYNKATGNEFKSFEEAQSWTEARLAEYRKRADELDITIEGAWKSDKKGKKDSKNPNRDESQAMIAELDRYYETQKTIMEGWLAKEKITKEQYDKMMDDNEAEHQERRSKLRSTFTKKIYDSETGLMRDMSESEVKAFKDWWEMMYKEGKLEAAKWDVITKEWLYDAKMTHEQKKALDEAIKKNNLDAQKDLTAYEKIYAKHIEAIHKIFEEDNPFLKLFNETQEDMTKLGVLVSTSEINNIEEGKRIMTDRINFLMVWIKDAYKKSSADLIADIKANPELSPWAAMLENNPNLAEALLIRTRSMYDNVQDSVKKMAQRFKRNADITWETEGEGGKTMKDVYEDETRSIERAQHAIEQYNSAAGAGWIAGRNADKLALKALESKMKMQKAYLALIKAEGEAKVRALEEQARNAKDESDARTFTLQAEQARRALVYATKEEASKIKEIEDSIDDKMTDMHYKMVEYIKSWGEWLKSSIGSVMEGYGTQQNEKYNQLATNAYYGTGNTGGTVTIIDNAGTKDASVREEYMTENEQLQWEINEENRQKQAEAWKSALDSLADKLNDTLNDIIADGIDDMNMREQMVVQNNNTNAIQTATTAIDNATTALNNAASAQGNSVSSSMASMGSQIKMPKFGIIEPEIPTNQGVVADAGESGRYTDSKGKINVDINGLDMKNAVSEGIIDAQNKTNSTLLKSELNASTGTAPSLQAFQAKSAVVDNQINALKNHEVDASTLVNNEGQFAELDALVADGSEESLNKYWEIAGQLYNDKIAELTVLKEAIQTMMTEIYGEDANRLNLTSGMSEEDLELQAQQTDLFIQQQMSMRSVTAKTQSMQVDGQLKADKTMSNDSKKMFNAMIQSANLFGAAYQTVADNNLSAEQKLAQFGLQAMGQAATAGLTALLSQTTAEGAANEAGAIGKAFSQMGPVGGAAAVAAITAILGAALGLAASKITKSKSQIASVTGASSGKLATGMLTYAKGRLPIYADGTEGSSGSSGLNGLRSSMGAARYRVQGNDGRDYSAAFEERLKTKVYQGGAHFGIFSEKKPEIVIGGDDTARILSQYPYLYDGILAVHRGQDPRLYMDYGYIQRQMERMSSAQKMSIAKSAFGRMQTFANGTLPDGNVAYDNDNENENLVSGVSGVNMAQTLVLMNELLTNLVENGVEASMMASDADKKLKKYERWKKRNGVK